MVRRAARDAAALSGDWPEEMLETAEGKEVIEEEDMLKVGYGNEW